MVFEGYFRGVNRNCMMFKQEQLGLSLKGTAPYYILSQHQPPILSKTSCLSVFYQCADACTVLMHPHILFVEPLPSTAMYPYSSNVSVDAQC